MRYGVYIKFTDKDEHPKKDGKSKTKWLECAKQVHTHIR